MTPISKHLFGLSGFLIVLTSVSLGAFVLWNCRDRKLARLWALFNLAVAMWGACGFFSDSDIFSRHTILWIWRIMWGFGVLWIPCLNFHFVSRLCGLGREKFIRFNYVVASFLFFFWWTPLVYRDVRWTFGSLYYGTPGILHPAFTLWWLMLVVYVHVILIQSLLNAASDVKNRLRYYTLSTAIGYAGGGLCFLPIYGIDIYPWANYAVFLYPLIMTYAILKHQLLDITVVIRKTLLYSLLTAILTAVYAGILTLTARVISSRTSAYTSAFATAVIAVLFHPLGVRIQRWFDRYFPREHLNPDLLREAAGGFAHEIKKPLAKISLPAESILNDLRDVKAQRKAFDEIFPRATKNLEFIIDQTIDGGILVEAIRELAMPQATPLEAVDLRQCITEAITVEEKLLARHGVEAKIPDQCPPAFGRPRQVVIILLNLIRNAAEAMADLSENKTRRITFVTSADPRWTDIFVIDTGLGFGAVSLEKIFEPYFTTKGASGTGLGLYLSAQLAQACGGNLQAVAQDGGAKFRLRLPAGPLNRS